MVEIHSEFREYAAPDWVLGTVKRLLASVPDAQCRGLGAIVLTERAVTTTRKSSRLKRRDRHAIPLGCYHRAREGAPAWIEIVVDEVVADLTRLPLANLQFFRDRAVGRVLFHELGHHLDCTVGAAARAGEPAAESWKRTLWRRHARRHYWYLRPFQPLFALLARLLRLIAARKRAQSQLANSRLQS